MNAKHRIVTIGDLNGPMSHLGSCAKCKAQFMSANERVVVLPNLTVVCRSCGEKQ